MTARPSPDWFTTFFDALANDFWAAAMPPEATDADVMFLSTALELGPGRTVLDVPCGQGRHALALAHLGCRVVAVDLSEDALGRLGREAAVSGLDVDVRRGDMRALPDDLRVDAAFCFGNSFGYVAPPDLARFLDGVARTLRPGGRFALETSMAAESVLPTFHRELRHRGGDIVMSARHRYDAAESRIDTEFTFERDGTGETATRWISHWVLTAGEVGRLVEGAGLTVEAMLGDLDGRDFALGDHRLVVVASRRERAGG